RLSRYQNVDFCDPQPYQKVLQVFGKNAEGKSFSTMTSYHENGYVKQYLEVVDGRAHGMYKEWHANGQCKMTFYVIEGVADLSEEAFRSWVFEGKNSIWDEQGALLAEIHYDKGLLQGNAVYYYPDGSLHKVIPYDLDKLHGIQSTYSASGKLIESIPYVQEQREGRAFLHTETGSLLAEEFFVQDRLMEGCYFDKEGHEIARIEKGKGKRAEFVNEQLKKLTTYQDGVPEGLVESFSPEGYLHISFYCKNGKKSGEELEYYPPRGQDSQKVKLLLTWQDDILQGIVKTWFPNGTQESQRELYQNKKNGPSFAWYKNGEILLQEEYENDQLITGMYYKKGDKRPVSRVVQGKGTASLYDADGHFLRKVSYEKGLPVLSGE
ncbi:MAG: hypothetical protein FJZ58_07885, partial [Chlamydiae bacterium]|nr:hypothetical protein [Chlamydiota bacterium]